MFKKMFSIFVLLAVVLSLSFSTHSVNAMGNNEVAPTPFFTILYGYVFISGKPAPTGTVIQFVTPRGEIAGEWIVDENEGILRSTMVYGQDSFGTPGFLMGEKIEILVNGFISEYTPTLYWQNDWELHPVNISVTTSLEITSMCNPQGIAIVFDGTQVSHYGTIWGTVSNGENDIPFLYASNVYNATAFLQSSVSSIKGEPNTLFFGNNETYVFKIWSGTYDSGPQILLDIVSTTTPKSCQNLFLPLVTR